MPKKSYLDKYPNILHTSLRINRKLWFDAKTEAAKRGWKIIQYLEHLIRKDLEKEKTENIGDSK